MLSSTTLLFIRTLAALGAVCLAAWVLLRWGLPRWLPHMSAADSNDGPIDVLARQPVGPKQAILLVRVADHTLVVGEAETGLSRLGEIPSKPSPVGGSSDVQSTVELSASDIVESVAQPSASPPERSGPSPAPTWRTSGALPIVELGESGLGDSGRDAGSSIRDGEARQSPSPVSIVEPVDPSEIQTTQETAAPEPGPLSGPGDLSGCEATSSEPARAAGMRGSSRAVVSLRKSDKKRGRE